MAASTLSADKYTRRNSPVPRWSGCKLHAITRKAASHEVAASCPRDERKAYNSRTSTTLSASAEVAEASSDRLSPGTPLQLHPGPSVPTTFRMKWARPTSGSQCSNDGGISNICCGSHARYDLCPPMSPKSENGGPVERTRQAHHRNRQSGRSMPNILQAGLFSIPCPASPSETCGTENDPAQEDQGGRLGDIAHQTLTARPGRTVPVKTVAGGVEIFDVA